MNVILLFIKETLRVKFDMPLLNPYLELQQIYAVIGIFSLVLNIALISFFMVSLYKVYTQGNELFENRNNKASIFNTYVLNVFVKFMKNLNLIFHIPILTLLLTASKDALNNCSYWYLSTILSILIL